MMVAKLNPNLSFCAAVCGLYVSFEGFEEAIINRISLDTVRCATPPPSAAGNAMQAWSVKQGSNMQRSMLEIC